MFLAAPLGAQIKYGRSISNLNGTVTSGYTADYGNQTASDHGWVVGGTANLNGHYYNPNFLSYTGVFYLNQSRTNSDFQSISNSSGFGLSANIFGGSRYPGSISVSKGYDSEGNYGIPGISNYVTHGNNDQLGLAWSVNLPHKPTFSAGFQLGNNNYSVYGTNSEGNSAFHTLNLRSTYQLAGFNMNAFYILGGDHSLIPEIVNGVESSEVHSTTDGFGFGVSHKLPLQGSVSGNVNRSTWNTSFQGVTSDGTIDTANLFAAVRPAEQVTVSASLQYSDNLAGQLLQSVVAAGAVIPSSQANESSDSLDTQAVATYLPTRDLQTSVFIERRSQLFEGENYGVDSFGGSAAYTRRLFAGNFNASVSFFGNRSEQNGGDTLGFSSTANYSNEVLGWHVTGNFGYSQNVQTLLISYMNSSYNFSGNARRRWGKLNLSAGAGGSRTALTDQPGTSSSSESYYAGIGYDGWFNANGSYSKSSGLALATGAGLVPVPVPSPVLPSNLVTLYGGSSYTEAVSSAPIKGLTMSASYARSNSSTSNSGIATGDENAEYNSVIQYRVRKMGFISGYARLQQGFSGYGMQPEIISSFYMGLTRWFNVF